MEANILHSSSSLFPFSRRPSSSLRIHNNPLNYLRLPALQAAGPASGSNNETNNSQNEAEATSEPRQPISTLNIRYRARSKRQAKKQQEEVQAVVQKPPKKEWESMTLAEKALELYVGEKGLLFWLNKFAYASIFIIIGGWIVFRFVGPSLGLYQLDAPPLSPTNILKGSS